MKLKPDICDKYKISEGELFGIFNPGDILRCFPVFTDADSPYKSLLLFPHTTEIWDNQSKRWVKDNCSDNKTITLIFSEFNIKTGYWEKLDDMEEAYLNVGIDPIRSNKFFDYKKLYSAIKKSLAVYNK